MILSIYLFDLFLDQADPQLDLPKNASLIECLMTILLLILPLLNSPSVSIHLASIIGSDILCKTLLTLQNLRSSHPKTFQVLNNIVTSGLTDYYLSPTKNDLASICVISMDVEANTTDIITPEDHTSQKYLRGIEWDQDNPNGFSSSIKSSFLLQNPFLIRPILKLTLMLILQLRDGLTFSKLPVPSKFIACKDFSKITRISLCLNWSWNLFSTVCSQCHLSPNQIKNFKNHSLCKSHYELLQAQSWLLFKRLQHSTAWHKVLTALFASQKEFHTNQSLLRHEFCLILTKIILLTSQKSRFWWTLFNLLRSCSSIKRSSTIIWFYWRAISTGFMKTSQCVFSGSLGGSLGLARGWVLIIISTLVVLVQQNSGAVYSPSFCVLLDLFFWLLGWNISWDILGKYAWFLTL